MSNPVKEKITSNLERAKGEGKIRSEHIREIVKDAVLQTVAELKEGSNEVRLIIKDAISTVISDLKGGGEETTEKITASIEGAISGSTYQRQQEISKRQAKLLEIQAILDQEQQDLDLEISDVLIDMKATESTDFIDNDTEAINTAINTVQERHESGILEEQYHKIKTQLIGLDQKLASRYGDRYTEVKQQWEQAKIWYDQKRTEAEVSKTIPLQEKQAEIEHNFGDFGATVARKEQEIKQRVQKLWGNDSKS